MVEGRAGYAFVDGRIVPLEEARVPLLDRGFLLGDGAFETLRTHKGRVFQMDAHLRRLEHGLETLGLAPALADDALGAVIELVAHATPKLGPDLYVRAQVTTGTGGDLTGTPGEGAVTAFVRAFEPWPERFYEDGLRVVISDVKKDTRSPLALVKSMSFLPYVQARREARRRGVDDVILLNSDGRVCESTTSNVFAVNGQTLYAPGPQEGALDGTTRAVVLEKARELRLILEDELDLKDLVACDEVFLTSTRGGVVPVSKIEELEGTLREPPGPITKQMMEGYRAVLDAL